MGIVKKLVGNRATEKTLICVYLFYGLVRIHNIIKPSIYLNNDYILFQMKESIILYGPENSLKYKKATELILPYSKSKLKYKRKIEISLNGEIYYYNISDVHFEIDFELLGTNEHGLWYEFINQVSTIVQTHPYFSIILCTVVFDTKGSIRISLSGHSFLSVILIKSFANSTENPLNFVNFKKVLNFILIKGLYSSILRFIDFISSSFFNFEI
jgi:hypothetical protein